MRNHCGIYLWTLKGTNLRYVGQSIDVFNRIQQHLASINDPNADTQWCNALKNNDLNNFKCEIIEFCSRDKLDEREAYWINYYDAYYNGFNSTRGNHRNVTTIKKEISNARSQIMLPVLNTIEQKINSIVKYYKNKNILVIGTFGSTLINNLIDKGNIVYNIENDFNDIDYWKSYNFIRKSILPQNDFLIKEIDDMKSENKKFDLVIANPPYSIGNKIISNVMEIADKAIVLMPLSKYKGGDLYKKVTSIELVDPKEFEDATITDNLCTCILDNHHHNEESWDEFAINSYDQRYVEFYKLNARRPPLNMIYSGPYGWDAASLANINHNNSFLFTIRTSQNGVHKDINAKDILSLIHI